MTDIHSGFHLFRDGDAWCAVGPHFYDLMRSPAGFGNTHDVAVDDLRDKLRRSRPQFYQRHALPTLEHFTVHS